MLSSKPYAFMTIGKTKSLGQLTAKGNHNMRVMDNDNVIKELSSLNREYVSIGDSWDVEIPEGKTKDDLTFADAFNSRIKELPHYKNHNVRSNGVYAYEIVMSYTKDENIDPYAWAERSMEWVHKTFDKAGDGKSNVLHAVLHMDEPGNPHLHVIVLPIDENCKLNAMAYTNGSRVMSELQTTYAKSVEDLGIQRGISGSSAKHKDIRKMYASINNVKADYPKPKEGQSAMDYYKEIQEFTETKLLSGYKQVEDMKVRGLQEIDKMKQECNDALQEQIEGTIAIERHKTKELKKKQENLRSSIDNYQDQYNALCKQLEAVQLVFQNNTRDQEELEEYRRMKRGITAMMQLEPEKAAQYQEYLDYLGEYGDEYGHDYADHDIDTIDVESELD